MSIEEVFDSVEKPDTAFKDFVNSLPSQHWAKYDLSAVRLGWEGHKEFTPQRKNEKFTKKQLADWLDAYENQVKKELSEKIKNIDEPLKRIIFLTDIVANNDGNWSNGMRSAGNITESIRRDVAIRMIENIKWGID